MQTLSTTTFSQTVEPSEITVTLASVANVSPGDGLAAGTELLKVIAYAGGTSVRVLRGQSGTMTQRHVSNQTVTIGRMDQFHTTDPFGPPPIPVQVSPWVNVLTGQQWIAQGDETGPNGSAQWWAPTQSTHGVGALGVRTTVTETGAVTVT